MSLNIYKTIMTIKEHENNSIYLTKNEIDGLLYVHRVLKEYHKEVYQKIKNINSPHIPKIYEIIEINDTLHIIEEYINAPTLESCILNGEIEESDKKEIIQQLCDAVILLHKHNIIHRDIKPENVFLYHGNVILFDFNISRCYQHHQEKDTLILGSVGYAAPEQFGFTQTDQRTDVYALGVLINYIYTGYLPNEVLYKGTLTDIIKKATHIDPNQRYQNVQELKKAISTNKVSSWAVPGFRSGILKHQILSCIGYGLFLSAVIFGDIENVPKGSLEEWGNKLMILIFVLIIIAFIGNYRNINRFSLFQDSHYKIIRYIGVILSIIIAEFLYMMSISIITLIIE